MNERIMLNGLYKTNGNRLLEGEDNYGCWFYQATGSGIWLNLGQSWAQQTKDMQQELDDLYQARTGRPLQRYLPAGVPTQTTRRYESYPKRAGALGFRSVQIQFKRLSHSEPYAEVVVVAPQCMQRNMTGLLPLRSCPGSWLDLRIGAAQEHQCICDDELFSLNCNGVPRSIG